jgi:hypothetical protein
MYGIETIKRMNENAARVALNEKKVSQPNELLLNSNEQMQGGLIYAGGTTHDGTNTGHKPEAFLR